MAKVCPKSPEARLDQGERSARFLGVFLEEAVSADFNRVGNKDLDQNADDAHGRESDEEARKDFCLTGLNGALHLGTVSLRAGGKCCSSGEDADQQRHADAGPIVCPERGLSSFLQFLNCPHVRAPPLARMTGMQRLLLKPPAGG